MNKTLLALALTASTCLSSLAPARAQLGPLRSSEAPALPAEAAAKLMLYTPVAPSPLPAQMVKEGTALASEVEWLHESLAFCRKDMRRFFPAPPHDQENVAHVLAYGLIAMVTTTKTDTGDASQAGFNGRNIQALADRLSRDFAANSNFTKKNADEKQALCERALVASAIVGMLNARSQKGDAAARAQAVERAKAWLPQMLGVTLDQVRVTPDEVVFG